MWRKIARRLVVAGLSLALTTGLVARSVQALDMAVKAAAATTMDSDMPMPGKCDGCAGSEKAMTPSACAAFCGTVIALPTIAVVYEVDSIPTMTFAVGSNTTGRTIPPDPHPPRPASLS